MIIIIDFMLSPCLRYHLNVSYTNQVKLETRVLTSLMHTFQGTECLLSQASTDLYTWLEYDAK